MKFILDKEFKNFFFFISTFFIFWLLYHLVTIPIAPLPYLDEIFFVNISDQLNKFNSLSLQLSSLPSEKPVSILYYGPVYFYLQSFVISNFGLNIFTVRFLSFFFGVLVLLSFTFFTFKKIKYPYLVLLLFCICATDMKFNANLHSGRMDFLAVLFFYASIYFFVYHKNVYTSFLSGILLSASFLTSPRIGFYFPVFLLLFYFDYSYYKKIILKYYVVFIVFLILVLSWIFTTFHSITNYLNYLSNVKSLIGSPSPLLKSHFGPNDIFFYIKSPVFVFYFLSIAFLFFKRNFNRSILVPLYLVLAHCLFIQEKGPYSAMILPLVYLSFIYNCVLISEIFSTPKVFISIVLLLLINCITFSTKAFFIFSDISSRRPAYVLSALSPYNLTNKKVLSGFKYYYIVNEKKGSFYSYDLLSEKINEKNICEFEYVLIDVNSFQSFSDRYKKSFKKVYPFKLSNGNPNNFNKIIGNQFHIYVDYDGYLIQL